VRAAQQALTLASRSTTAAVDTSVADTAYAFDRVILEKGVAQEQANVETLEGKLASTRLFAPYSGVVTTVLVRAGDPVDPAHPALTMAKPGPPVMRLNLSDQESSRVKVGQKATIFMDGVEGPSLEATISSVSASANGVGRMAQLKVTWGAEVPGIGKTSQVAVIVQHKENVLLAPKKAIRTAGARKYVQYVSGSTRKIANVEVGISSENDVEILTGLTEGQVVVVGV
jgi:multidrug efflux pump subunit AcrA (membrane-fusion protein)